MEKQQNNNTNKVCWTMIIDTRTNETGKAIDKSAEWGFTAGHLISHDSEVPVHFKMVIIYIYINTLKPKNLFLKECAFDTSWVWMLAQCVVVQIDSLSSWELVYSWEHLCSSVLPHSLGMENRSLHLRSIQTLRTISITRGFVFKRLWLGETHLTMR